MLGKQEEPATGRSIGGGALSGVVCRGAGSRAAGEGGGRSMAEPMERRGPARGKEGRSRSGLNLRAAGARPGALARRRVRDRKRIPQGEARGVERRARPPSGTAADTSNGL